MRDSIVFITLKSLELIVYVAGFPFLFVGAWAVDISDKIGSRAERYRPDAVTRGSD